MLKTITVDGKRHACNTDTAKLIEHRTFGAYGDPAGYEESVYRMRGGFTFIHGIGGEASPYPEETIVPA